MIEQESNNDKNSTNFFIELNLLSDFFQPEELLIRKYKGYSIKTKISGK